MQSKSYNTEFVNGENIISIANLAEIFSPIFRTTKFVIIKSPTLEVSLLVINLHIHVSLEIKGFFSKKNNILSEKILKMTTEKIKNSTIFQFLFNNSQFRMFAQIKKLRGSALKHIAIKTFSKIETGRKLSRKTEKIHEK